MNLFDYNPAEIDPCPPPSFETAYAAMMRHAITRDTAIVRARGFLSNWTGNDDPLQQDEARLIAACPLQWHDLDYRIKSEATRAMGLTNVPNARAVIDRCIALGYVDATVCGPAIKLDATDHGLDMLDEYNDLKEYGIL
jgi:hypothetical protein